MNLVKLLISHQHVAFVVELAHRMKKHEAEREAVDFIAQKIGMYTLRPNYGFKYFMRQSCTQQRNGNTHHVPASNRPQIINALMNWKSTLKRQIGKVSFFVEKFFLCLKIQSGFIVMITKKGRGEKQNNKRMKTNFLAHSKSDQKEFFNEAWIVLDCRRRHTCEKGNETRNLIMEIFECFLSRKFSPQRWKTLFVSALHNWIWLIRLQLKLVIAMICLWKLSETFMKRELTMQLASCSFPNL